MTGHTDAPYNGPSCAAPGQSHTIFHSPYVPDDGYSAWTYDRQWEPALAEVFLSFGNDRVVGTVGLEANDFTDVGPLGNQANPAQLGIGQGWITVTPGLPVSGLRLHWKVGAFWEKFGTAGKYDAGPYDTYMFGRTHQVGESLALQYDVGDLTLKIEHGFGAHLEMTPAGIPIGGSQNAYNTVRVSPDGMGGVKIASPYPPGGSPAFTLLDHLHAGVSYKKRLEIGAHYLASWAQDDREEGTLSRPGAAGATTDESAQPDGSLTVVGVDARLLGGAFGDLYAAYSHIEAKNVTTVGPAIEVIHSYGGGGHNFANGVYENFFGATGNGTGRVDSVEAAYELRVGALWREIRHPGHAHETTPDVKLALFLLYSAVSETDPSSVNLLTGRPTAGSQKLKYGADLVATVAPWLALGARADYVQPDSHDAREAFAIVSPKVIVRTRFVTHEEITLQYSHYWNGADALPQQWLAVVGPRNIATAAAPMYTNTASTPYPSDENVFGIKATLWW
jgi:hypothetical protein